MGGPALAPVASLVACCSPPRHHYGDVTVPVPGVSLGASLAVVLALGVLGEGWLLPCVLPLHAATPTSTSVQRPATPGEQLQPLLRITSIPAPGLAQARCPLCAPTSAASFDWRRWRRLYWCACMHACVAACLRRAVVSRVVPAARLPSPRVSSLDHARFLC